MDRFEKHKISFIIIPLFIAVFSCTHQSVQTKPSIAEFIKPIKPPPASKHFYFAGKYNYCYECPDSLYVKYLPVKTFEDFPAPLYSGPLNPIRYESHSIARFYKTAITNGYKDAEVNFAGHYVYISWGCGAPCTGFAIVDAITGNVYPGPTSAMGCSFRKDSRLLLTDPPDENNYKEIFEGWSMDVTEYIWDETSKKFIETELEIK